LWALWRSRAPLPPGRRSSCVLVLALTALTGCIEDRLNVEITTRILADGTTLRRTEYRLVRVDTDKDDVPLPLPPAEDPLRLLHRFPAGESWAVRDQPEEKAHGVTLEATLPSPNDLDWDYWRVGAPGSPLVARNHVSFAMTPTKMDPIKLEAESTERTYEYLETFADPASPAASARRILELLPRHEEAFAASLRRSLAKEVPRSADLRHLFRDGVIAPTQAAISRVIDRPLFGPRERQELHALLEKSSTAELTRALSALAPALAESDVDQALEKALGDIAESIANQLKREGLPIPDEARGDKDNDAIPRLHFRVTLVMPGPIKRANGCLQGDTVSWEFDRDDLYGRGFEMWAQAVLE
jgi:hypothetical protein